MCKQKLSFILFIFLILTVTGCYYTREGYHLLRIYSGANDFDAELARDDLSDDERELLENVIKIKKNAVDRLGLKENKSYTTYAKINRNFLVYVLSACECVLIHERLSGILSREPSYT